MPLSKLNQCIIPTGLDTVFGTTVFKYERDNQFTVINLLSWRYCEYSFTEKEREHIESEMKRLNLTREMCPYSSIEFHYNCETKYGYIKGMWRSDLFNRMSLQAHIESVKLYNSIPDALKTLETFLDPKVNPLIQFSPYKSVCTGFAIMSDNQVVSCQQNQELTTEQIDTVIKTFVDTEFIPHSSQ